MLMLVIFCAGGSTCCDTCCSACSCTQLSVCDHERLTSKLMSASQGVAVTSTPSSPFKVFRSSERYVSDSEDSLDDSLNNVSRTPPYAGVDVEEVEMMDDDGDSGAVNSAVALQSHRLGTEVVDDVRKPQLNAGNGANTTNVEEPLLLMPGASNTLDTLFGEVSDSDSEHSHTEPVVDNSAIDENNAVLSVNNHQPSASATVPSADVEDGEITDSDTEPVTVSCTNPQPSAAGKENAAVNVKTGGPADTKQSDCNRQNTRAKLPGRSEGEHGSKSTSRTPPRRRISSDHERNLSSGNKNNVHCNDRKRSPQLARNSAPDDRKAGPAARRNDVRRDDVGGKCRSSGRSSDHRQLSPRKSDTRPRNVQRSSTNSGRFTVNNRRNVSARGWPARRRY